MENNLSIAKPDKKQVSTLNYYWYREEGLKHIEELASKLWTDYNTHDPGITILEVLAYALSDLGYRTSAPILDLLAEKSGSKEALLEQFFTPLQILPNRPTTILDYRKLLIDVIGIKNAWLTPEKTEIPLFINLATGEITTTAPNLDPYEEIEPHGLYKVILEFEEDVPVGRHDEIIASVKARLHANRNLCEDFSGIEIIKRQQFILCGEIEVKSYARIEKVEAEIFFRIQNYLSPGVRTYSLKEMLAKGKKVEEIYEGTLYKDPQHVFDYGFIDDAELEASALKETIYLSDIQNIIMSIPDVVAVRDMLIQPDIAKLPEDWNKWIVPVKKDHMAKIETSSSRLVFYKDVLPFRSNPIKMNDELKALQQAAKNEKTSRHVEDMPLPVGEFVDPADYYSISNDFPETYGVGDVGLPERSSEQRKAQTKQLKGYLLFFDQILANYFAQLGHIKELFSSDDTIDKTCFTQEVNGITGLQELYGDYLNLQSDLEDIAETKDDFRVRRNRFLDHLLARFNEKFSEYVALMYSLTDSGATEDDIIYEKARFLQDYLLLSMNRGGGFNYTLEKELWDTFNVTGLEHRVARLVGIANHSRRNLAKISYDVYQEKDEDNITEYRFRIIDKKTGKILISSSTKYKEKYKAVDEMREGVKYGFEYQYYEKKTTVDGRFYFNLVNDKNKVIARRIEYFTTEEKREDAIQYLRRFLLEKYSGEGMFVVEHILLRPTVVEDPTIKICLKEPTPDCPDTDPYSSRISVVLPAWHERFADMNFRRFLERTLREETPAHIYPRICWINEEQMSIFEDRYKKWLTLHAKLPGNALQYRKALAELLDIMSEIKNIYPEGTLHDCIDGSDKNPVILGSTSLGSMHEK